MSVIIEAFLWGLGTAIGELPPYFVARAGMIYFNLLIMECIASLAGRKHEELEEMLDESKINETAKLGLMDKIKVTLYKTLKKHAFVAVLLCASVIENSF